MELKDLEIFQKVVEKGTITKAAKELNYVQSNITSRIQKLEAELNTPLLHRHPRGISLTPEGRKLLTYSKKILSLVEELKATLQNDEEPSGKLEIGTVETVHQLPEILSSFINKYSKVDISLVTGVTEALEKEVLEYRLDGAFVSETDFHPDIVSYEVFEEELVVISDLRITSLEEIKKEPFLCFSKGCAYRARLETWYRDQKIKPARVLEFGTFETILRSVAAGLGISFVPRAAITHLVNSGQIRCHILPDKYSKIKTVFIRRADTSLTPVMQKFIKTIQTQ